MSASKRERLRAELQMTGRPPVSATGFVGFKPAVPPKPEQSNEAAGDA